MRCFLFIIVILLLSPASAEPYSPPALPPKVAAIKAEIQRKKPEEIRAIIVKYLGEHTRNMGSGINYEVWDTQGGRLVLAEGGDFPTFDNEQGVRIYLIDTTNLVGENLFGRYEMLSKPLPSGYNDWLGELWLYKNLKYKFVDSKRYHVPRAKKYDIFFLEYPEGKIEVHYAPGISAKTRLEEVKKGTVAKITFISGDDKHAASFDITTDPQQRDLNFTGDNLPFQLHLAGWKH